MVVSKLILAFCAERYPCVYSAGAIARRITASQLTDHVVDISEVEVVARDLARRKYLKVEVDIVTGEVGFSASVEGREAWVLAGQEHIQ